MTLIIAGGDINQDVIDRTENFFWQESATRYD